MGTPLPTPLPTTLSTPAPSTPAQKTCPSNISDQYQFLAGVRACATNADCDGFETLDGPTCCLYPFCICQNPDPGASGTAGCVSDVPDRTDDDDDVDGGPGIPIGTPQPTPAQTAPPTPVATTQPPTPSPTQPVVTPAPTPSPAQPVTTPAPTPSALKTCPSDVSDRYQSLDGVRACTTNADCDGFETLDGPTCCLFPFCICQNPNPGASGTAGCVS